MMHMKLLILLYTDDTVLMAESAKKNLIFSKGLITKRHFYYNESIIENVEEFKYLGIIVFSRSGSFCKSKKHLCEQAQKLCTMVILDKLDCSIFQVTANSI